MSYQQRQLGNQFFYLSTSDTVSSQIQKLQGIAKNTRALIDATTVDSNGAVFQDVLAGISFGDQSQRLKRQLILSEDQVFKFRHNRGTSASPNWTTRFYIDTAGKTTFGGDLEASSLTTLSGGITFGGDANLNGNDIINCGDFASSGDIDLSGTLTLSNLTASRTLGLNSSKNIYAIGGIREVLTAARTYYVRSDGSNNNTGLTNSASGAFLTLAKAISVVAALDLSTFAVTIQIGLAGSYAGFSVTAPFVGSSGSSVTVLGNTASASSYVITSTVTVQNQATIIINGVDFSPTSGDALAVQRGSFVTLGVNTFGTATARQILATDSSTVTIAGILTMDGGAAQWILATGNSTISSNGFAHVFSGTPAYSTTVAAQTGSIISVVNGAPSGSATGTRYSAVTNAVIFTNGGGANHFPGNVAGSTATGGQYV